MVVGTLVFVASSIMGAPQAEVFRAFPDVLRAFPILLLYSLMVAGPFGIVAGILGGALVIMLGGGRLRGATRSRWVRSGVWVGGIMGGVCPLFLLLLGFGPLLIGAAVLYAAAGMLAGGLSGAALGHIGWREFGSRLTASAHQ
jgi:hypothetical protein